MSTTNNTAIGQWTTSPLTTLPPAKRYITTHNASGKSIVHSQPAQSFINLGNAGFARSYTTTYTSSGAAVMKDEADIKSYTQESTPGGYNAPDLVSKVGGTNCLVVDLGPGGESQMHRTVSVDYSIVAIGRVKMELDGGETIVLGPGDHVVQRGTMHKWINASQTEPARLFAITIPAEPFEVPGTGEMLEEKFL